VKISLCIITLNEELDLGRCLRSAADVVDEIVIVDSGSKDRTEQIARDYKARFIHQTWLGYVGQKNLALSLATNNWILSLDADEELSEKLRNEIRGLKTANHRAGSGYSMPRCVYYEGKWIRHGDWYPDRLVRLFRKKKARFTGGKVHERLEIDGPIIQLSGEIHHYSFRDAADHRQRCENYARLWAESQVEQGGTAIAAAAPAHAFFRFMRAYFLKRGFLDGTLGLRIAAYAAREVYLKYKLLRELNRHSTGAPG
jgi:glycosyltransferase involved in cell wall biosynthesis